MTTSSCRVFLVRHGESAWNAEARLQGQADPPLSKLGRHQAKQLRDVLAQLPPAQVLASDLLRATETAELAGFSASATDPRWREADIGDWTGKLEAEVAPEELSAFRRAGLVPPHGESWPALQRRVGLALEELARTGGDHLVFTHGGCVRAAAAHLTGARPEAVAGPANASVTLLEMAPRRRLLAYNWTLEGGLPSPSEPGGRDFDAA